MRSRFTRKPCRAASKIHDDRDDILYVNEEWAGFQRRETEPSRDAFHKLPDLDGFVQQAGPYEICLNDGIVRLAFEVEARHCNPNGACHGGALATLLDTQLAIAGRIQ